MEQKESIVKRNRRVNPAAFRQPRGLTATKRYSDQAKVAGTLRVLPCGADIGAPRLRGLFPVARDRPICFPLGRNSRYTASKRLEYRAMPRLVSEYPNDVTVYLVINDYGRFGRAFVETDIAEADRETVLRNFISGQYSNALRVIAFDTAEGWSRDVSDDIVDELPQRACDADENLGEDTKRFVDRYMRPGEKRPPAASVRRTGIARADSRRKAGA
jgi:hypothetical protein